MPEKKKEEPEVKEEPRIGGDKGEAGQATEEAPPESVEEPRVGGEEGGSTQAEEEISEEEFRRLLEESLEKVTVAEITLTMMNQLASVGFLKMGLPENVNLKYRDLDQASLAIDILEAMLKGADGKMPEEALQPFRGTLANMQLNFVQLKRGGS